MIAHPAQYRYDQQHDVGEDIDTKVIYRVWFEWVIALRKKLHSIKHHLHLVERKECRSTIERILPNEVGVHFWPYSIAFWMSIKTKNSLLQGYFFIPCRVISHQGEKKERKNTIGYWYVLTDKKNNWEWKLRILHHLNYMSRIFYARLTTFSFF